MNDPTEGVRRQLVNEINAEPGSREALKAEHGQVWDASELQQDFNVLSFMAPFCIVERKADNVQGSIMFQHNPRFYFKFEPKK